MRPRILRSHVQRALWRKSLAAFIAEAWKIVEPATELVWNWHLDVIAEHLEAVTAGQIQNLIINEPPGHMKSLQVGVFWPAWVWARKPEWRVNYWSYSDDLAVRDSIKCRSVIRSDWYQQNFVEGAWQLASDQDRKHYFLNTRLGFRAALSVGGQTTGYRGDAIVIDDPLNAKEAYSKASRDAVITAYDQGIGNRLNDLRFGSRVVIMQRLHQEDLTGHLLEQGGWEHLCLPSEFEPKRRSVTYLRRPVAIPSAETVEVEPIERVRFWEDPRQAEGELLFPAKFPAAVLAEERKRLGTLGYPGQHQQRPTPPEGGMFQRGWWRFWRHAWEDDVPELRERTMVLPAKFAEVALSWDCAFKGTDGSDFVAGGVWARDGANRFLLDLEWRRMDFPETVRALRAQAAKWPRAGAKLVEDTANGPAVIATLRGEIPGIVPVKPEGGKESRAAATSPQVEAGNVYLPLHAEWRDEYIEEHADFPLGAHDDAVDQQSQMLLRWGIKRKTGIERLRAMGRV